MSIAKKMHKTMGPHEAVLTLATIQNLRMAETVSRKGSKGPARAMIPIRHSPKEDQEIWVRIRHSAMSAEEALMIATKGTEEQKIELAGKTTHAQAQIALGRDESHVVYDALLSSKNLTAKAAMSLLSRARMGENYRAAYLLEGRLKEMDTRKVRSLQRRAEGHNNRASERV